MANLSDTRSQARTLETATRIHTHWTQRDLDVLKDCRSKGVPDRVTAEALRRSLYGVRSAVKVLSERREKAPAFRKPELPFDRGFTTLEEMGF